MPYLCLRTPDTVGANDCASNRSCRFDPALGVRQKVHDDNIVRGESYFCCKEKTRWSERSCSLPSYNLWECSLMLDVLIST
jgi:hypothetical protein